jgi:Ca2+-binding EF-hand superfamily protein
MRKLALAVSAAALAAGGIAYAAPGMMDGGDMTRAEAQEKAQERFAKMDINQDGQLNADDRAARMDGRFDTLDADGNGAISREEFIAGHDAMGGHRADRGEDGHHGWKGGKGKGHERGDMMKMADKDGDGTVSSAEFAAAHLAMFDKADTNQDGTVTRDERRAAHKEMRTKWKDRKESSVRHEPPAFPLRRLEITGKRDPAGQRLAGFCFARALVPGRSDPRPAR